VIAEIGSIGDIPLMKAALALAFSLVTLASLAPSQLEAGESTPASAAPVVGRDWEMIDGDSETRTFLDPAGSTRRGNLVRARLVSIYEQVNDEGVGIALAVVEIDCRAGVVVIVEERLYASNSMEIDGGIIPPAARQSRVPAAGTKDARLVLRFCGHAARARPRPDETIVVRFRHSYPMCVGLCPDFEARVSPRRWVVSHNLHRREIHRFRVTPLHLASFRAILDTLRPAGESWLDAKCARGRMADGTPDPLDDPRPDDVEVRWIGAHASARLTACGYTHLAMRRTIENAMRVLGVDPYFGGRYREWD
jgi:hypothetical protein